VGCGAVLICFRVLSLCELFVCCSTCDVCVCMSYSVKPCISIKHVQHVLAQQTSTCYLQRFASFRKYAGPCVSCRLHHFAMVTCL
jgi:hypothetical protein